MVDYNRAIELDSKCAPAYYNRGNAKITEDDLDGAMADFNRLIELNSKDASAYRARARLFFETQNWNGAVSDFRRCCELDARDQDYPRLDIWLVRSRLGESVAANAELDEFVRKRWNAAPGDWVSTTRTIPPGQGVRSPTSSPLPSCPTPRKSAASSVKLGFMPG